MTKLAIKCLLVGDNGVGKTSLMITHAENSFLEKGELPKAYRDFHVNMGYSKSKQIDLHLCNTLDGEKNEPVNAIRYKSCTFVVFCFSLVSPDSLESIREHWIHQINEDCRHVPKILVGTKLDLRNRYQQQPIERNEEEEEENVKVEVEDEDQDEYQDRYQQQSIDGEEEEEDVKMEVQDEDQDEHEDDDHHETASEKEDNSSGQVVSNGHNHVKINYVTTNMGKGVADEIGAQCYLECSSLDGEGRYEVFDQVIKIAIDQNKKANHGKSCNLM
ncbi:Ras-related protein Rac2 [Trichoplax sp. H2]|nr:Ras-related protein Rac2 [Trichoplax sp. H2]|eukprot:RDD41531.1 Ras-related protein Rac2 [Trichoplax sp. H2]